MPDQIKLLESTDGYLSRVSHARSFLGLTNFGATGFQSNEVIAGLGVMHQVSTGNFVFLSHLEINGDVECQTAGRCHEGSEAPEDNECDKRHSELAEAAIWEENYSKPVQR